jgi:undecaprenyl-diphosphatase
MGSVILYFWPRWKKLKLDFFKWVLLATAVTGLVGWSLKKGIEAFLIPIFFQGTRAEIEQLFKSLPLIACGLFVVGILIWFSGSRPQQKVKKSLSPRLVMLIGLVQGLCLPLRGFSRSGATISTAILGGLSKALSEDFSFALAVALTPAAIWMEGHRLVAASGARGLGVADVGGGILPGILGMALSFIAGLVALRWLSSWLEQGKWKYFGLYCMGASIFIFGYFLTMR